MELFELDGKIWSFSRINLAKNCGRQYNEKYIKRSKPDSKPLGAASTGAGVLLHDIIERCIVKGRACSYDWPVFSLETMDETWAEILRDKEFTKSELDIMIERRSGLERVTELVFGCIQKYGLAPQVEAVLCMDVNGNMNDRTPWPKRAYIGYVDFLGITPDKASAIFLDFKSHYQPKQPYDSTVWQKKFYYHFLLKKYPTLKRIQGGIAYIPSGVVVLDESMMTRADDAGLEAELKAYIDDCLEDVRQGIFTTNTGKYCEWCGWYNSCPEHTVAAA